MIDGSRGATALVGLPGFVVGAQELVDDEWWLFIETDADVVGCPDCGVRAVGHGRRLTAVRDLPVAGHPVVLVWAKRRWRCGDPDCATRTWLETSPEIAARASLSRRARRRIADMVNIDGDSIAHAAAVFGVGWGIAGYCPGPALASLTTGVKPLIFTAAMVGGMAAYELAERLKSSLRSKSCC